MNRCLPLVASLLVGLLAEPGCAPAIGEEQAAIVGGVASDASDDQVVLMLSHNPAKDSGANLFYIVCTATLLAPDILLTARHCVSPTGDTIFACDETGTASGSGGMFQADLTPAETLVFVGPKLPTMFTAATASALGKTYVHGNETASCNADVALVVLDRAIANAKLAAVQLDGKVSLDETLKVVGWGATETASLPSQRIKRDAVPVVEVGPEQFASVGGGLGDKEFIAGESVCVGDSGAPAFDEVSGAVVGVAARGAGSDGPSCVGTQHIFSSTAGFSALISSAFAMTGESPLPVVTPSADAAGASTDAGGTATPHHGGCAMARSASPSAGPLGVALLFAILAARRRKNAAILG